MGATAEAKALEAGNFAAQVGRNYTTRFQISLLDAMSVTLHPSQLAFVRMEDFHPHFGAIGMGCICADCLDVHAGDRRGGIDNLGQGDSQQRNLYNQKPGNPRIERSELRPGQ